MGTKLRCTGDVSPRLLYYPHLTCPKPHHILKHAPKFWLLVKLGWMGVPQASGFAENSQASLYTRSILCEGSTPGPGFSLLTSKIDLGVPWVTEGVRVLLRKGYWRLNMARLQIACLQGPQRALDIPGLCPDISSSEALG